MDYNEMYEFGIAGGSPQDESGCQSLLAFFQASLQKISDNLNTDTTLNINDIQWFPEYACAIITFGEERIGCHKKPSVELMVVGLDQWRNEVQSCGSSHYIHSSASSLSFSAISLLPLPKRKLGAFWTIVNSLIANAQSRKGEERSSKDGARQGHQKTPGFLLTILRSAIEHILSGKDETIEYPPVPGWTGKNGMIILTYFADVLSAMADVGLHTGGKPRKTPWPLVKAVYYYFYVVYHHICSEAQFCQVLCHCDSAVIHGLLLSLNEKSLTSALLDKLHVVKASFIDCISVLIRGGVSASSVNSFMQHLMNCDDQFQEQFDNLRRHSGEARSLRSVVYSVLRNEELKWNSISSSLLTIVPPTHCTQDSLSHFKALALKSIDCFPLLEWQDCHPHSFCQTITNLPTKFSAAQLLYIVEGIQFWFFSNSHSFLSSDLSVYTIAQLTSLIDSMLSIFEKYRSLLETYRSYDLILSMKVESVSCETLVTWICFCGVHRLSILVHALLGEYGVGLNPDHLKYLVLKAPIAERALENVVTYLGQLISKPPVFSGLEQDRSSEFAERFASNNDAMLAIWQDEHRKMEAKIVSQWNEKQRRLQRITQLETDIVKVQKLIVAKQNEPCSRNKNQEIGSLQTNGYQLEREIEDLKLMPISRQPLPKSKLHALPVIFFANIPRELSVLCCLSFEAQLMVISLNYDPLWLTVNQKRSCPDNGLVDGLPLATSIPSNYHSSWVEDYPSEHYMVKVTLFSDNKALNCEKINVERYNDKANGVRYLSRGNFMLGWSANNSNPFLFSSVGLFDWTRCCKFTQQTDTMSMVYAPITTGTFDKSRGNFELCNSLLQSLSGCRHDHLLLSSLRSFEEVQPAKIISVIYSVANLLDDLSFTNLLRMSVFQYGTMGKLAGGTTSLWAQHICLLQFELFRCVESWKSKQSFHLQLLTIIQVVNYLSQQGLLSDGYLARRIAQIASDWAGISERESRAPQLSFDAYVSFRAKSCHFWLMTLCTFPSYFSGLTQNDVSVLVRAIVCARLHMTALDYCRDDNKEITTTKSLFNEAQCIIASASIGLCNLFDDDPESFSHTLSQCTLLAITNANEMLTEQLTWRRVDDLVGDGANSTLCFEADTHDPASGRLHLFSINLVNGIVLKDGLPVGRLSVELERSPTYLKLFGDRMFEVIDLPGGSKRIQHPYFDFYFEFLSHYDSSGVLQLTVIREVDSNSKTSSDYGLRLVYLEPESLLDIGLPKRLIELHYHWFSEEANAIYFSEKHVESTRISFLYCCSAIKCFVVPEQLASQSFRELYAAAMDGKLSELIPSRVYPSLGFYKSLLSLEAAEFVHIMSNPDSTISYALPRLSLQFRQEQDGTIKSVNFAGFIVASNQQLQGMVGFHQYILLTNGTITRVITTFGTICNKDFFRCEEVQPDDQGMDDEFNVNDDCYAKIVQPSESSAKLKYCWYDLHPSIPEVFIATTVESRLYLALLVSANASYRIDEQFGCRGHEYACELIRGCFVSRMLTKEEATMVQQIMKEYTSRCPTVYLLCYLLLQMACQLDFLPHDRNHNNGVLTAFNDYDYLMSMCKIYSDQEQSVRTMLTSREIELLVVSSLAQTTVGKLMAIHPRGMGAMVSNAQSEFEPVYSIADLKGIVDAAALSEKSAKFYLTIIVQSTPKKSFIAKLNEGFFSPSSADSNVSESIVSCYVNQLRHSWQHLQSLTCLNPSDVLEVVKSMIRLWIPQLQEQRDLLTRGILAAVGDFGAEGSPAHTDRLLSCHRDLAAIFCINDILRVALDKSILRLFNKHLSQESIKVIQAACLQWMTITVLYDKFTRMMDSFSCSSSYTQELSSNEFWNQEIDPVEWLVFEVENRLQIRPNQYSVARFLISNPGSVTQLNMGEGKTRVIIPMLIMYWLRHAEGKCIVRVHFLSQLIGEAYDYLHRVLTASVMNIQLVMLPFNRDVQLNHCDGGEENEHLQLILSRLKYCQDHRACLLVAPEHRLSLHLKHIETSIPDECIASFDYIDIHDESDELFRYRYQLIYAVGAVEDLPSGVTRWTAAERIILCLDKLIQQKEPLLNRIGTKEGGVHHPGQLVQFRLVKEEAIPLLPELHMLLWQELLHEIPFDFIWLQNADLDQDSLADFVLNLTSSIQLESFGLPQEYAEGLLAFRGILSFGILGHCLFKRNRVEYGVNRGEDGQSKAKKRLAIPFKASETPAARSEYAHPDCAIIFTILAYCHDGLTPKQLREAFDKLMLLAKSEMEARYSSWFKLSKPDLFDADFSLIDSIEKIDLSNVSQWELLVKAFSYNMETVFYWLNVMVFPVDTKQYPNKIIASSWNLTENKRRQVTGFSGTDDTSMLLPKPLQQKAVEGNLELQATNGLMLELIARNSEVVTGVFSGSSWKSALQWCHQQSVHALIDCGAWLTGISIREAAMHYLHLMRGSSSSGIHNVSISTASAAAEEVSDGEMTANILPQLKAVVFYDKDMGSSWRVLSPDGLEWKLNESPIREHDCFVLFDESHCRGADMKLLPDAKALLTLGPYICKDKLMQAAGRMRKLAQGQSVIFAASPEIEVSLRSSNHLIQSEALTSVHILHWVVENSVRDIEQGMLHYIQQGCHYIRTQCDTAAVRVPERSSLHELYSNVKEVAALSSDEEWEEVRQLAASSDREDLVDLVESLGECARLCADLPVATNTSADEECEREIEQEKEKEIELEVEDPVAAMATEVDWPSYNDALVRVDSAKTFVHVIGAMSIKSFCRNYLSTKFHHVKWPSYRIYVTKNFAITVDLSKEGANFKLDSYLQLVDFMLCFADGTVLVISDREAAGIIRAMRLLYGFGTSITANGTRLVNYCYINFATQQRRIQDVSQVIGEEFLAEVNERYAIADPMTRTAIELFAGETTFPAVDALETLQRLLPTRIALDSALEFALARGLHHQVERSELQCFVRTAGAQLRVK